MRVPLISVGILSGKEIEFSFPIKFISSDGTESSGMQKAIYRDGKIHWPRDRPLCGRRGKADRPAGADAALPLPGSAL